MTLGDYIKEYRKSHQCSMDDFARVSGLSKAYVSILERNFNPSTKKAAIPSLDTIKRVATATGADFNELIAALDGDQEVSLAPDKCETPYDGSLETNFASNQKAPTGFGEPSVSDDDIKLAVFQGRRNVTDAMYAEVLKFAEYVAWREDAKIAPRQECTTDTDIRTVVQKLAAIKGSDYVEGFITGINRAPAALQNGNEDEKRKNEPLHIIKIAGRDGSMEERALTDEEAMELESQINELPGAPEGV